VIFPNWGLNFGWYLKGDGGIGVANITAWNRWACEVAAEVMDVFDPSAT